jgi:hypothetical protein
MRTITTNWGEISQEERETCQKCFQWKILAAIPSDDPFCKVLLCARCLSEIASEVLAVENQSETQIERSVDEPALTRAPLVQEGASLNAPAPGGITGFTGPTGPNGPTRGATFTFTLPLDPLPLDLDEDEYPLDLDEDE